MKVVPAGWVARVTMWKWAMTAPGALLLAAASTPSAAQTAVIAPAGGTAIVARTESNRPAEVFMDPVPNGSGVIGNATAANAGTVANMSMTGDFGRFNFSGSIVATPQVGVPSSELRISEPGRNPYVVGVVAGTDSIKVNSSAAGPLFATAHVNVSGTFIATRTSGVAFAGGSAMITRTNRDGNVTILFYRSGGLSNNETTPIVRNTMYDQVSEPFAGSYSFVMPFTSAGVFNRFSLNVFCSISFDIPSSASGEVACNNLSLTWGGISELRDQNGDLVADWTATSRSSFDYTQPFTSPVPATPVPEPTTWAMMIIGFALVGGVLRRRRSLPRPRTAASRPPTSR